MTEGSLYDRELAALAIWQAQGDLVEAIFLLRAYRTTLPRFGFSTPINTARISVRRRISATFKDIPGGQILGPTYDYTHRLLDFSLEQPAGDETIRLAGAEQTDSGLEEALPRVVDLLDENELIEMETRDENDRIVRDLTRQPLQFPAERDCRLQNLARGDEGFLLALAYSVQRGFGYSGHPFVGEIRLGEVAVEVIPPELGFPIEIGEITVTECVMISRFDGSSTSLPKFTQGYGLTFGHCERKSMAMALVDRALRCREFGEELKFPSQDEEFVLNHSDNVEASGFVQHLKLPHHVDFQAELVQLRRMRLEAENAKKGKWNDEAEA
jgi:alpha-D-ribose 1-methylphosphonate 5-triphosphate synthase subunit PhnI